MKKTVILNTLTALLASACALDTQVAGEDAADLGSEVSEGTPRVGRVAQALGAPRLHAFDSRHFGGNIAEEDHWYIVGGECAPGYMRSGTPEARWNGNGACEFRQWDNPANVRDCRVRVHAHTNAFWGGGTCQVWVYEERAPAGSCRDARGIRCGGASADNSCFCDTACETYGDCCLDYLENCG